MGQRGRVRRGASFTLFTLLPIFAASAVSVLGIWASADPTNAPWLRPLAVAIATALGLLLVAKAIRDYRWGQSLKGARYDAVQELHNRLGPALDLMTEMALLDPSESAARASRLRTVAAHCCSALVSLTPESADVRAVVFELRAPNSIAPLERFGRVETPRTFDMARPNGQELWEYLNSANPKGELYEDTRKEAPPHYTGDTDRYRTFIRTPIYANGVVFGMLTLDAPKNGSLSQGDVRLAELVAAELGIAFAIAAG